MTPTVAGQVIPEFFSFNVNTSYNIISLRLPYDIGKISLGPDK